MCSVSIVSLLLSLSSLSSSVSLTPATSSLLSIQFQRSVSVVPRFRRSTSALFQFTGFLFIALASIVLRFRFQYPIVFVSSPSSTRFSTSSRSRHLYNMSPIMTFLVSGLLPFVLASLRRLFILGFLAMSPVPFMASCFSLGVQVGCCHAVGSKIPAKLPFLPGVQVGCCLPSGFEDPHKTSHFCRRRTSWLLPPRGFEDPRKTSFPSRRTSWLLPPSGVEDPCKTSLSSPLFRLGQSLCISPPIVHRPFEFPLSCVVSFHRISYLPFLRLPYSRYPFFVISFCLLSFGFSSLCRFLVVLLIATYPTSFRLFLRYFRYPLSPVCLLFRFRLSFVFYSPYTSWLFSVSAFVSSLIALSIPVLFSIVSSFFPSCLSSFVPSSFGIPLSLSSTCLPSLPCHHPSSPVSFLLRLLFRFSHLVVCVPVFECALSVHVLVLWFNPSQLSLSSSVSAFVSILAN